MSANHSVIKRFRECEEVSACKRQFRYTSTGWSWSVGLWSSDVTALKTETFFNSCNSIAWEQFQKTLSLNRDHCCIKYLPWKEETAYKPDPKTLLRSLGSSLFKMNWGENWSGKLSCSRKCQNLKFFWDINFSWDGVVRSKSLQVGRRTSRLLPIATKTYSER